LLAGEGKRVKATLSGVTTAYLGNYYEWSNSTYKEYYYAGAQRLAVNDNGTLYWLLGDHLGSTSITANSGGGLYAELRYKPWGEERYTNGVTTPTRRQYTGQINDVEIGLYFYNARMYSPALGRFISADTIVPGAGSPQAFNRYAYALNSPLNYIDPSGHVVCSPGHGGQCADGGGFLANGSGGGATEEAVSIWGGALLFPLTVAFEAVDTVVSGAQCAGGDGWACVGAAVPFLSGPAAKALGKVLDAGADAARAVDNVQDVRHATNWAQSVLNGIDLKKLGTGRFGKAFYVAEEGGTAVAEVAAHGNVPKNVVRFQIDLGKAKVLDLTDFNVAKAWGYVEDVDGYVAHQAIAQKAFEQGYNAIKFGSYRGAGSNYALLENFNFEEWLIPQMVSPATP
jgi:RHS repeat-associated protein